MLARGTQRQPQGFRADMESAPTGMFPPRTHKGSSRSGELAELARPEGLWHLAPARHSYPFTSFTSFSPLANARAFSIVVMAMLCNAVRVKNA